MKHELSVAKRTVQMLQRQETLQCHLDPNWVEADNDHILAAVIELGEMCDWLGYKWWKHVEFNVTSYEQAQLELVDVWHFVMNKALTHTSPEAYIDFGIGMQKAFEALDDPNCERVDILFNKEHRAEYTSLVKHCMTLLLSGTVDLYILACLSVNIGLDFDTLYGKYMAKSTLNLFRWNNGYGNGTYRKIWYSVYSTYTLEDNEVMLAIIAAKEFDSYEELYTLLGVAYAHDETMRQIQEEVRI